MKSPDLIQFMLLTWEGNRSREPHKRRNLYITGEPGLGKSDVVHQAFRAYKKKHKKAKIWDIRLGQYDPTDVRGFPGLKCESCGHVERRCQCENPTITTAWFASAELPQPGEEGILFLDELPQAPLAVQNAILQLTRDYRLGSYSLPEGISIVAAGNRLQDQAGANRLTTALADRFHPHLAFDVNAVAWADWATANGVRPEIISFNRAHPESLAAFDPKTRETVWASPRSWAALSDLLDDLNGDNGMMPEVTTGTVGAEHGNKFIVHVNLYSKLPSFDAMMANPTKIDLPLDNPAGMYAIICSIVGVAKDRKLDAEAMKPLIKIAERLPQEYSICLIRDLDAIDTGILDLDDMGPWLEKNAELLVRVGLDREVV